jgi:hypothetical protein
MLLAMAADIRNPVAFKNEHEVARSTFCTKIW